jgi:hypothetical protein
MKPASKKEAREIDLDVHSRDGFDVAQTGRVDGLLLPSFQVLAVNHVKWVDFKA